MRLRFVFDREIKHVRQLSKAPFKRLQRPRSAGNADGAFEASLRRPSVVARACGFAIGTALVAADAVAVLNRAEEGARCRRLTLLCPAPVASAQSSSDTSQPGSTRTSFP